MKKKINKIIGIFLVFIAMIFVTNNNIYAKDLQIHATIGINGEYHGVEFYTFAGAYYESVVEWKNSHNGNLDKTFNESNMVNESNSSYYVKASDAESTGVGNIMSSSFLIHNKAFSNYSNINNPSSYIYDSNDAINYIGYSTNMIDKNISTKYVKIISANNDVNFLEFRRLIISHLIFENNGNEIYVGKNFLSSDTLQMILNNVDKYKYKEDDSNYIFYISEPYSIRSSSATGGYLYCDNRLLNDENKKSNIGILTAYQFLTKTWYQYPAGYDFYSFNNDGKFIKTDGNSQNYYELNNNGANSFLNAYDNLLYIPKSVLGARQVYVRHLVKDKDGNIKSVTGNDSEVEVDSNGGKKVINNNTNSSNLISNNKNNSNLFTEYYEIPITSNLTTTRLRNIIDGGKAYKQVGVEKVSASTFNQAWNKSEDFDKIKKKNNTTPEITTNGAINNTNDVTLITYIYEEEDTTPPPPDGGVDTIYNLNEIEDCQMSYTPTGQDLTPYLKAYKIDINDLSYNITIENGKLKYQLSKFRVDKLISGNIANNTTDPASLGYIFGGANDKEYLLQGNNSSEVFSLNSDVSINEIDNFKNKYSNTMPTSTDISNFMNDKNNITSKSDFTTTKFRVPDNRYNGLRIPKISANYQSYDVLTNYSGGIKTKDTNNISKVLVYNPITVGQPSIKVTDQIVDHTTDVVTQNSIQNGASFELTLNGTTNSFYPEISNSQFLDRYYIIFSNPIQKTADTDNDCVAIYDINKLNVNIKNSVGNVIPANSVIELSKDAKTFRAKAGSSSSEETNSETKITVIGMSNNMPNNELKNDVLKYLVLNEGDDIRGVITQKGYIGEGNNTQVWIDGIKENIVKNYCGGDTTIDKYNIHNSYYYDNKSMYGDAYYFAKATTTATDIGRIYDFKVTDCSDVDYKNVFRKNTSDGGINDLTGIQYFSGIKEFKVYGSEVNTLEDRSKISISGTASRTIIPLGPYKNTNTSYINAPKLGYRISFDLKTSGGYTPGNGSMERKILIKPSYYYISKDGSKFYDNVDLYYKNSSGKYVKFDGSNYTIYFKPNDGYRFAFNDVTEKKDNMSVQLESLEIGNNGGFVLNDKMMTSSSNKYIQAWYGEFKLPNSTIATGGGSGTSVSKPLTDGYIGVRFDIESQDIDINSKTTKKVLSYNVPNKNASPINTTQWDYEGFLGFNNPGNEASNISLQLEKGTWTIDNDKYNKIKGTVILYDTDNRAANDFE